MLCDEEVLTEFVKPGEEPRTMSEELRKFFGNFLGYDVRSIRQEPGNSAAFWVYVGHCGDANLSLANQMACQFGEHHHCDVTVLS